MSRHSTVLSVLLSRMRHDGCGGIAGKAELLTGIESAAGRPVRKIVLVTKPGAGGRAVPAALSVAWQAASS